MRAYKMFGRKKATLPPEKKVDHDEYIRMVKDRNANFLPGISNTIPVADHI